MKLDVLLKGVHAVAVSGSAGREIEGVVCDSRQVRPGYLFVAVRGEARDGLDFVGDAVARGAAAVISESAAPPKRGEICHVRVADARRALAQVAAEFHGRPSSRLEVIGITGTNGKTTSAHMACRMLRAAGRNPGLLTTVGYEVGARSLPAARTTPEAPVLQSLLAQMAAAGCRSAVMEVSSHGIVQKRVAGIDFDVGVFTNLTRDHLDYHGTLERYFEAKAQFILALGSGAKPAAAVINADDPWGRRLLRMSGLRAQVLTYGLGQKAGVRAEEITVAAEGTTFLAVTPWGNARIRMRLLGRHNVCNALAALAACGVRGVGIETAQAVLGEMTAVPGRLEEFKAPRGFRVFVDYAHTDDALEHVLTTLREITAGRLIAVFGCGGNRDATKRAPMGKVAARLADYTILTSDNPRKEEPGAIIAQIREGFGSATNVEVLEERAPAIRRAVALAREGDTVLVAGKGHETTQEFATTIIPFDDRLVVAQAIQGS